MLITVYLGLLTDRSSPCDVLDTAMITGFWLGSVESYASKIGMKRWWLGQGEVKREEGVDGHGLIRPLILRRGKGQELFGVVACSRGKTSMGYRRIERGYIPIFGQ